MIFISLVAAKKERGKRWRRLPKEPQACERALNWIERVARPIKHARSMKLRVCHTVLPLLWRRKRKETQHTHSIHRQSDTESESINIQDECEEIRLFLSSISVYIRHIRLPMSLDIRRARLLKKYNLDFLFQFEEKLV